MVSLVFSLSCSSLPADTTMISLAFSLSNSYIYSHMVFPKSNQNQNPPNKNRRNWKWSFGAKKGMSSKVKMRTKKTSLENYLDFVLSNMQINPTVNFLNQVIPHFALFSSTNFIMPFSFFVYHWKLRNSSLMFCVKFCRSSTRMGSRKSTRFKGDDEIT